MEQVITIGLDLAKNVFQVHGADAAGRMLVRKQLRRAEVLRFFSALPACLVGMEACGTAHHWARELTKLGHTVRLMPPAYVKPYVKRGKTDAGDAEAIAAAVTRPTMRFVAVKTVDQQSVLMLHKVRDLLVRQRTMLINALRGHLAEFGIIAARGPGGVSAAITALHEAQDGLPDLAQQVPLTAAVEKNVSAASASRVMAISGACSSSAPPPSSVLLGRTTPARPGPPGCSSASRQDWYRWRLPTRQRESPGRSSRATNPARPRPCSRCFPQPTSVRQPRGMQGW